MPNSSAVTRECFALFDDAQLPEALSSTQDALRCGLHAVGVFDYELGAQMHAIAPRKNACALTHILLFEQCRKLSAADVTDWLAQQNSGAQPAGIAHVSDSVSEAQFKQAIHRIQNCIEAGDTYQINYTYRIRFDAFGSPLALYRRLRERQPVPYGTLIVLPDERAVLSLSPELFAMHANGIVTARPMKGTAPASGNTSIDAARANALARDPKNRAENLMIVDLLRNDLGRIAATGSVRVPHLFQVHRYPSVPQMTSTIEARLRDNATLADIFAAIYPCGSITGAPKRRTMQIIREFEPDARGIYTGAIGWFDTPGKERSVGDFCMSVPIRTLMLAGRAQGRNGCRRRHRARQRSGGGICGMQAQGPFPHLFQ